MVVKIFRLDCKIWVNISRIFCYESWCVYTTGKIVFFAILESIHFELFDHQTTLKNIACILYAFCIFGIECDFLGQLWKDLHSVKYASDHVAQNVSLPWGNLRAQTTVGLQKSCKIRKKSIFFIFVKTLAIHPDGSKSLPKHPPGPKRHLRHPIDVIWKFYPFWKFDFF